MRFPIFSKLFEVSNAKDNWNDGVPDLQSPTGLAQAQIDAKYWAHKVKNLPDVDEQFHLERFHFFGLIADASFWSALTKRYLGQSLLFWYPVLDSAIESGNVVALEELSKKFTRQELFYEWRAHQMHDKQQPDNFSPNNVQRWMHPQVLLWFNKDPALQGQLQRQSKCMLVKEYADYCLFTNPRTLWDSYHGCAGSKYLRSRVKDWCELPVEFYDFDTAWSTVIQMHVGLSYSRLNSGNYDPPGMNQKNARTNNMVDAMHDCIKMLCTRASMPEDLMRTLSGRMLPKDFEDPILCAVAQFMDKLYVSDLYTSYLVWGGLSKAQLLQVNENAKRAEPLPALLQLQTISGMDSRQIYALAESFMNPTPNTNLDIPDGALQPEMLFNAF